MATDSTYFKTSTQLTIMKLGRIIALFGLVTLLAGVFAGEIVVKMAESRMARQPAAMVRTVVDGNLAAAAVQITPFNARPSNPFWELIYFFLYLFHRPV